MCINDFLPIPLGDSPRRPRRRYRRCKLLDPDDSPPVGSKEGAISAPASRGGCVHSGSDSGGEDCSPPSVAAASDSSLRSESSFECSEP